MKYNRERTGTGHGTDIKINKNKEDKRRKVMKKPERSGRLLPSSRRFAQIYIMQNRNTNQFLEEDGVYSGAAEVAEELTPSHHKQPIQNTELKITEN